MKKSNFTETSVELYSLAQWSLLNVSSYLVYLSNDVLFLTHNWDSRHKTQNSGVFVSGTEVNTFYSQLKVILEFTYLNGFSVILFKCKWFNIDPTKKIIKIYNNITSINISSEWCKYDQFILVSQAKQVFYVDDLSNGPNGKVVVNVNHRHIWDIPDNVFPVLPSDIDMLYDNNSSNFTLSIDLSDFELHQTKVINVKSMVVDENVQHIDDFIDDNEVQYDDTLEDYIDDEDVEYESDDETSKSETENLHINSNDSDE